MRSITILSHIHEIQAKFSWDKSSHRRWQRFIVSFKRLKKCKLCGILVCSWYLAFKLFKALFSIWTKMHKLTSTWSISFYSNVSFTLRQITKYCSTIFHMLIPLCCPLNSSSKYQHHVNIIHMENCSKLYIQQMWSISFKEDACCLKQKLQWARDETTKLWELFQRKTYWWTEPFCIPL